MVSNPCVWSSIWLMNFKPICLGFKLSPYQSFISVLFEFNIFIVVCFFLFYWFVISKLSLKLSLSKKKNYSNRLVQCLLLFARWQVLWSTCPSYVFDDALVQVMIMLSKWERERESGFQYWTNSSVSSHRQLSFSVLTHSYTSISEWHDINDGVEHSIQCSLMVWPKLWWWYAHDINMTGKQQRVQVALVSRFFWESEMNEMFNDGIELE